MIIKLIIVRILNQLIGSNVTAKLVGSHVPTYQTTELDIFRDICYYPLHDAIMF